MGAVSEQEAKPGDLVRVCMGKKNHHWKIHRSELKLLTLWLAAEGEECKESQGTAPNSTPSKALPYWFPKRLMQLYKDSLWMYGPFNGFKGGGRAKVAIFCSMNTTRWAWKCENYGIFNSNPRWGSPHHSTWGGGGKHLVLDLRTRWGERGSWVADAARTPAPPWAWSWNHHCCPPSPIPCPLLPPSLPHHCCLPSIATPALAQQQQQW